MTYYVKKNTIYHNRDYVICSYFCITKNNNMPYKCHNFRKDRDGQWSCWATHICYKPFCLEGDLFTPALTIYHGRVMTLEEKEKLVRTL